MKRKLNAASQKYYALRLASYRASTALRRTENEGLPKALLVCSEAYAAEDAAWAALRVLTDGGTDLSKEVQ